MVTLSPIHTLSSIIIEPLVNNFLFEGGFIKSSCDDSPCELSMIETLLPVSTLLPIIILVIAEIWQPSPRCVLLPITIEGTYVSFWCFSHAFIIEFLPIETCFPISMHFPPFISIGSVIKDLSPKDLNSFKIQFVYSWDFIFFKRSSVE